MFLDFSVDGGGEEWVRFDAVDMRDVGGVETVDLVACSRPEFQNDAAGGEKEGRHDGCGFEGDESFGWMGVSQFTEFR